jgi:site-specific recombinase XerD
VEERFQLGDYWLSTKKNSPFWQITWFDEETRQTRRHSSSVTDFEQAKLALADWVVLNTTLKDERPEDIPVNVILDRYWNKSGQKLKSKERTLIGLTKWKAWWVGKTVSELTIANQKRFIEHLRSVPITRGSRNTYRADGSIARDFGAGKAAFSWAYKEQEIKSHPYILSLNSDSQRKRVLTIEEAAQLFNAAAAHEHTWRYMLLAFGTAARPSAILGLTTKSEQVNLLKLRLDMLPPGETQQPKKRKPMLTMPSTLVPWLRRWMQPEALVYTSKRKAIVRLSHLVTFRGKPIKRVRESFDMIKERAGITDPEIIAYTIRHTMSTWMAEMDVPDTEREMWLGHRAPGSKTTARYTHLKPEYLKNAAAAVDAYFDAIAPLVTARPIKMVGLHAVENT